MKKSLTFKQSALAVAIVMASGYVGSAAAHWIPGDPTGIAPATLTAAQLTKLGGTNAYDVYHATCFTDNGGGGVGFPDALHGVFQQPDSKSNLAADHMKAAVAGVGLDTEGMYRVTLGANRTAGVGGWVQNSCTDWDNTVQGVDLDATEYCNASTGAGIGGAASTFTLAPVGGTAGNGGYDIVVSHPLGGTLAQSAASPAAATKGYNVIFHCEDALNRHTGTSSDGIWNSPDYVQQINY